MPGTPARLAIVGGGRMGEALLSGLISRGWAQPSEMAVVEASASRREELVARHPGVGVGTDVPLAEGVVVAVKPGDVEAACALVAAAGVPRVLSVAAGVTLARLEEWLGPDSAVVRAMPNTPALLGSGAAAIAGGSRAGTDDLDWAEGILAAVGVVVRVGESLLDAVTGLSGSGPAYVFLVAEALIEAGVSAGLPRPTSEALVIHTLVGAARMLAESGETPAALRAAVTSPGGTTAAGLRVMESRAVRSALIEAVAAAADRSRQLGEG